MSENLLRIYNTDGFSHIFYRKYLKRAVEILEIEGMKIWKDADIFGTDSET